MLVHGVLLKYTNMAAGNLLKHLEFILAVFSTFCCIMELKNIRIDTSPNILAV